MFLSPVIYQWSFGCDERGGGVSADELIRGYDIWRHAASRLDGESTELHRVDCISALRRVINQRLKLISAVYKFELLPTSHAKRQMLEKLQDFGLVRPVMLKELLEVRNSIEHEDVSPPAMEVCHRFVDIVWYFLKSTDVLIDEPVFSVVYESDDGESHIRLTIEPSKDWSIGVEGLIVKNFILNDYVPLSLKLEEVKLENVKNNSQLKIKAIANPSDEALIKIAHEYFNVAGYWHDDY